MPTLAGEKSPHSQCEPTIGEIAVASAWLVAYLIMIVMAVTGQTLGHVTELAAHY